MHVECSRHLDASEPDAEGMYEYHYEYDIYHFTQGAIGIRARSYTYEPGEAHFLAIETHGKHRLLVDADMKLPLMLAAQNHLRLAGKLNLRWLSGRENGYELVPSVPSLLSAEPDSSVGPKTYRSDFMQAPEKWRNASESFCSIRSKSASNMLGFPIWCLVFAGAACQ